MDHAECLLPFLRHASQPVPGLYDAAAIEALMAGFDLQGALTILQTRRWAPGQIRLMRQGIDHSTEIGKRGIGREAGLITRDFIESRLADDMTFVIPALHVHDLDVRETCRRLSHELGCAVQANAYLSPPGGVGFPPHWDAHDVFAVQMAGCKEWRVEASAACEAPVEGDSTFVAVAAEIDAAAPSYLLTKGKGLFVPRGHTHCARSLDDLSLHVTLAIRRWTWGDLAGSALALALRSDAAARSAIPQAILQADRLDDADIARIAEVLRAAGRPALLIDAMASMTRDTFST
jgi:hypothetical protein